MPNRRDFLATTALAAAAITLRSARAESFRWPPYRDTIAIDGEGGFDLLIYDDAADTAKDIAAAHASGLSAVLFTVAPSMSNGGAFEAAKNIITKCKAKIATHAETFLPVENRGALDRARRERRVGLILRFQGAEPLADDIDRVALFRGLGVRVIQLTHNRHNLVGDGCMAPEQAGLSRYGYEVVERLNAEKIVVDLAHGSQQTIADGIKASKAPVLISHTGCRALADLPRNTSDTELRAMAERGGVAGIIFWPYLRTDTQPMAIDVIRHIEHAIDVCGEDHVGIGTDGAVAPTERGAKFEKENREYIKQMVDDGVFAKGRPADLYAFIPDLNMANRFEVLAAMLSTRGHSDARIAKILGGNFARVFGEVWD